MAASALFSQLAHFLSFMREHPKLSFLLLLLLSPPIFRVLLYFTPLLLSTALCISALITLAPYVNATDAEVERQSLLGTSSYQPKSKASVKDEKDAAGGFEFKSSSAYPSTSSLSPPSASFACPSVSVSSSPPAENSWMSWMKGLNDIGRAWVESKLAEQGLAHSEPASRETLLALVEGSFAELATVKENYADIFSTRGMDVGEDNIDDAMRLKDMDDDLLKKGETENDTREPMMLPEGGVLANVEAANLVDNALDVHGADTLPAKSVTHDQVDDSAEAAECLVGGNVRANQYCASESKVGLHNADETTSKPRDIVHDAIPATKAKPPTSHESALPVIDDSVDAAQSSTFMPKTPSRIPGPSKLIEASRRIFSKEEQSKSMLPRAPFQLSSRVLTSKPSIGGAAQSKFESTVSAIEFPTRKFLSSKSTSKKTATTSAAVAQQSNTSMSAEEESRMASQGTVKLQSNARKCNANDSVYASVSGCGDFTEANVVEDGPKFDEDLEVEEAQALVRSELKMLEVELEEVAAKLPELDGALAYQKTPVKSATSAAATMLSPTRTPQLKSNMALFSAIPVSK
ncbi:hypothetical protein L7F22_035962 [Adiantum nelumboides]|nr:hypothetical protein [Adiantum nelumboides]